MNSVKEKKHLTVQFLEAEFNTDNRDAVTSNNNTWNVDVNNRKPISTDMRGRKNDKRNDKETQMNEVVNEKDNNNEGIVMTNEEDTIRTHNEDTSDEGPVPITGDYINDNNIINIDNNSFFISITT